MFLLFFSILLTLPRSIRTAPRLPYSTFFRSSWFGMLRDRHWSGALIPPRRPHPRCRRPAALAHLALILDRAKRRSGLLKPFARGPDGMSQHSPITLRFCQSSAKLETKA